MEDLILRVELYGRYSGRIEARETSSAFLRASGPVQYVGAYAMMPEEIEIRSATK